MFSITPSLLGQDFSLCSVVDAKHNTIMLGWTQLEAQTSGYSFHYNGHEVTPFRPTIDDISQLTYTEGFGYGSHTFQLYGYNTELTTNKVTIDIKRPQYYTALIPGLYQALHQERYVSSCSDVKPLKTRIAGIAEPVAFFAATGFATYLWIQFFDHRNAALNARDTYLSTLRGEELSLWRQERDKAQDVFPKAMAVSIATLTLNAISTLFLSPRGKATVRGGFNLDCASHPGHAGLCFKL